VKRSTLNFQWGDRKGAWWRNMGTDRRIWATGGSDMGTDTMSGITIRNVQLSTFNGVTERAHGGRDIGTDTKIWATGAPRYGDRHGFDECGDRHDVRYADQERRRSNIQLSTFNGMTERAQGGRNMGTDTELRRPGF